MKFLFKARTKEGVVQEGAIEAASEIAAVELLQKNNFFPISLHVERNTQSLEKTIMKYFDRVDSKELMMFFRQLAILIEAKVPIVSALKAIQTQTENPYFSGIIGEAINDIEDGLPFSDALKKHKDVFSNLSISIIRSGEISGNLRKSVTYVADNIEKNYNLTNRVKSAMTYPLVILAVFFVIAFIVVSFIIPKLTLMIKELNVDIPWYTKIVVGLSDFMAAYWWAVAVVILGAIGGMLYYIKTEDGGREWDQIKIKLPIFGKIFQGVYVARFADNLSVLLAGGIPIIQAIIVVSAVVNNWVYEQIFLQAADEVKKGGNMSDTLRRHPEIPPIVTQMVKIGEESGQIDSTLRYVAEFYEQETNQATKNLSTLIEPILMIIIGIAVGFLAFAVIMPIYNLAGQM